MNLPRCPASDHHQLLHELPGLASLLHEQREEQLIHVRTLMHQERETENTRHRQPTHHRHNLRIWLLNLRMKSGRSL